MSKAFASFSFGCRVNQAEKEELDKKLRQLGFIQSDTKPDFYIINTCAVTQKAEREARQLIYQTKRKYPKTKIVVTGCSATKWINEKVKVKGADLLIDNTNKEYIAALISNLKSQNSKLQLKTQNLSKEINTLNLITGDATGGPQSAPQRILGASTEWGRGAAGPVNYNNKYLPSSRLLLKIQDGCQRFCTYCIVPYLRGKPQSRSIKEIVRLINSYCRSYKTCPRLRSRNENPNINEGVDPDFHRDDNCDIKEVILTAINTEAYGYDTGESFIDLISSILNHTSIPRISFGSIHPWSMNDEFFSFYKRVLPQKRLVDFFHIPLQSGSNKMLTLMKRGYSREEILEKLKLIKKINPFALIGTDIIVGFLEENDRDFEETYNFLADSPISKFHIFRFSRREKTAAYFMAKRLKEPSSAVKIKRAKILAELSRKKYKQFLLKHLNLSFMALFLEKRIEGHQASLLNNQIPAFIRTNKNLAGEIKRVKIEKLKMRTLFGWIS